MFWSLWGSGGRWIFRPQDSFHEVWAHPSPSHVLVSFSAGNSEEGKHPHILWSCGITAACSSLVISLGNSIWLFLLLYFPVRFWIGLSSDVAVMVVSSMAQDFIWESQSLFLDLFVCVCVCSTSWMCAAIKSPFRDFSLPYFPPLIRRNRYILFCLLMAVFILSIYGLNRSRVNTIWCQYSSNIVMQPSYIYDLFPL